MNLRIVACSVASLLLGACGGGGGASSSAPGFSIQLQQTSISLQYREGSAAPSTEIVATWRGTPPNPLYIAAYVEGVGVEAPVIVITESNARATVRAASQRAGEYGGRIVFLACADPSCTSPVGGSPLSVPYTVKVTPPAFTLSGSTTIGRVNLTHGLGQPAPTRTLNINAGAGTWSAVATVDWITLSQTSGNGGAALVMSIRPELLTTARLEGTVTVSTQNLGTQTLDVQMLMGVPNVLATPGVLAFSGIAGAPLAVSRQIEVRLEGGGTLPMTVSADRPWIAISQVAGDAPGSFVMSLAPSAVALPSGNHTGTVTVHLEGGRTDAEATLPVQLTLARSTLSAPSTIVFGGDSGRDFDGVPVTITLNTGGNAYLWTVSQPPSWLQIDRPSGIVGGLGDALVLRPIPARSTPGVATTSLQFSATVNGEIITRTVPVEFAMDTRRLIASETGIAFTDLPGTVRDDLSRTIKVRDNYEANVAWSADDDAAWLTVTPSGVHGGDLVVSADTTGLQADQLYTARIRISTAESSIEDDEYVHVGLWVGTTMPTTNRTWGGRYWAIVGDPIRPYVYAREQAESVIRVFHVYTGVELPSIAGIPTSTLDFAVSKDGQTLYALASNDVVPVNLVTRTVGPAMTLSFTYDVRQKLTYIRPNGVGVLLDNRGWAHLASSGEEIGGGPTGEFAVSGDDRWAFWADSRWALDFSSPRGNRLLKTNTGALDANDDAVARLAASNFDASRVYMARFGNSGPRRLIVFDGRSLDSIVELETLQSFSDLLVTRRGQAILSKVVYGDNDITIYNPDNSVALSGIELGDSGHDLSATGDGNFALISSYSKLTIVPIPR